MADTRPRLRFAGLAIALCAVFPVLAPAQSPSPETLAAFRADPRSFFFEQRAAEAIACGQVVLQDPTYPPADRIEALTTLGAIYVSTKRMPQARAAFFEIIEHDPLAELSRADQLPPPVLRLCYVLRDSLLLEAGGGRPDIRTVAVGEIENNSIVQGGAFDLDRFALGLQHVLVTDLKASTPLRIVDRQRLDVLLEEIGMNQNDEVFDPRFSVPLGQLCGAQYFLFGCLFQVEEKKIRLDLKWVDTSTTEVLLSEGLEMKIGSGDDLLALERKVLLDLLLPKMHQLLVAAEGEIAPDEKELEKRVKQYFDEKKRAKKRLAEDKSYVDLLLSTGEAILAEERGDLAEARLAWERVQEIDPLDPLAEDRQDALVAYLDMQEAP